MHMAEFKRQTLPDCKKNRLNVQPQKYHDSNISYARADVKSKFMEFSVVS
jgi:hypothetical protein